MTRRRDVSEEEQALWHSFARSIKPLRAAKVAPAPDPAVGAPIAEPKRHVARAAAPTPQPSAPPLAPLDRRFKQRVGRGRAAIDARIDLHGMTQTQAHAALLRFLQNAQADDARVALVVTGKGAGRGEGDMPVERGVLRRQVPLWLALPEFRRFVVGFDSASAGHGGQGALYVRLRRER